MDYVRSVKDHGAWAALEDGVTSEAIDAAARELLDDLAKYNNVSVFARDRPRGYSHRAICVGMLTRRRPADLRYVVVLPEDLETLGIRAVLSVEDGGTGLDEANQLHHNLEMNGAQARALVARIAERHAGDTPVHKVTKSRLRRMTRTLIRRFGIMVPPCWLTE